LPYFNTIWDLVPYDINSASFPTISIYPVLPLAGQSCAGVMEDESMYGFESEDTGKGIRKLR